MYYTVTVNLFCCVQVGMMKVYFPSVQLNKAVDSLRDFKASTANKKLFGFSFPRACLLPFRYYWAALSGES